MLIREERSGHELGAAIAIDSASRAANSDEQFGPLIAQTRTLRGPVSTPCGQPPRVEQRLFQSFRDCNWEEEDEEEEDDDKEEETSDERPSTGTNSRVFVFALGPCQRDLAQNQKGRVGMLGLKKSSRL